MFVAPPQEKRLRNCQAKDRLDRGIVLESLKAVYVFLVCDLRHLIKSLPVMSRNTAHLCSLLVRREVNVTLLSFLLLTDEKILLP